MQTIKPANHNKSVQVALGAGKIRVGKSLWLDEDEAHQVSANHWTEKWQPRNYFRNQTVKPHNTAFQRKSTSQVFYKFRFGIPFAPTENGNYRGVPENCSKANWPVSQTRGQVHNTALLCMSMTRSLSRFVVADIVLSINHAQVVL